MAGLPIVAVEFLLISLPITTLMDGTSTRLETTQ